MRLKFPVVLTLLLAVSTCVFAQGGKAEPNRIKFSSGKSSTRLTGTLRNGHEMEYVFSAAKGQKITIRNSSKSLFDFRIFNSVIDFDTEFESSPVLSIDIPESGEYLLFIRRKLTGLRKPARFSLSLAIQ